MKVVILGAESSHAATFAKILAGKDGSRRYEDVELVGVYADKELSDSQEGIELIRKWSSCDYVTNDYDEFNVSVYFGTGYTVTLYRTGGQADPVKVSIGSSETLLDEFFEIVRTGHNPQDPADWIAPVVLVDATIRAYESGEWVECRSEDACLL